jgi:(S)-ureidoglycine aminohydrolase
MKVNSSHLRFTANFKESIMLKKIIFITVLFLATAHLKAQNQELVSGVYQVNSNTTQSGVDNKPKIKVKGSTTDLEMLSMHSSELAPGKINHPPHALLDREELIIVKEGPLTITINEISKVVSTGSIVLIEAGDSQSFQNASDKVVSYYVLGFKAKALVNISRGKENGGSLMKDWNELVIKKTAKGESRPVFDKPTTMFGRFEVHSTALNLNEESHPTHTHKAEEIMLLLKGNITMHIEKENYKAGPGSIILVRPDVPHNLTNTGNETCQYYAIKWYATNGN